MTQLTKYYWCYVIDPWVKTVYRVDFEAKEIDSPTLALILNQGTNDDFDTGDFFAPSDNNTNGYHTITSELVPSTERIKEVYNDTIFEMEIRKSHENNPWFKFACDFGPITVRTKAAIFWQEYGTPDNLLTSLRSPRLKLTELEACILEYGDPK